MKAILIPLASSALLASSVSAEVEVILLKIHESRSETLRTPPGEQSYGAPREGSLTIQLMLGGPEVKPATHYGAVVFTEAKDDTGRSLANEKRGHPGEGFTEIDRKHMWFMSDDPPDDKIKVDLYLGATERAARKLTLVQGTVTLRTTATKNVLVAPEPGKKAKNKLLDDAGVKVTIESVDADQGNVELTVVDPNDKVGEVECVNAKGEDITMGTSSFGFNKRKQVSLDTGEPLPEGAKLRISIKTGMTDLEVPFKLEDVNLP